MSDEQQYVECFTHEKQQATYVCQPIVQSLRDGIPREFWPTESEPGNLRPDSWCNKYEEMIISTGEEWNDESEEFAGITLLCGACYDRANAMNENH